jgi:enoyl-CoA hydratase
MDPTGTFAIALTTAARFAAGEIKLGWLGGAGATQLLPRTTSKGFALKMLLTGDQVTATEAQLAGLVDQIVPAESLEQEARALAQRIVANAPIAAQLIKHLVRMSESTSLEVGLNYENDLFAYCFTTEDAREGREAFLEKRAPGFMGR